MKVWRSSTWRSSGGGAGNRGRRRAWAVPVLAVVAAGCGPRPAIDAPAYGGGDLPTSTGSDDPVAPTTMSAGTGSGGGTATGTSAGFVTTRGDDPWGDDGSSCSTYLQDCPEGQKCMLWDGGVGDIDNYSRCVVVAADPRQPGEPCTVVDHYGSGLDNCDVGSFCSYVDPETLEGECVPYCTGNLEHLTCTDPDRVCFVTSGAFTACFRKCDPLVQDCGDRQICTVTGYSDMPPACLWDASDGTQPSGAPCEYVNTCNPGNACVSSELVPGCPGYNCCTPFCDMTDPGADAFCASLFDDPEIACRPYDDPGCAPEEYDWLGLCRLPDMGWPCP